MPHPPRHLDDITAVHQATFQPRHYRVEMPPQPQPTAPPWWFHITLEAVRSLAYVVGLVLGVSIIATAAGYVIDRW